MPVEHLNLKKTDVKSFFAGAGFPVSIRRRVLVDYEISAWSCKFLRNTNNSSERKQVIDECDLEL
jgi:hypothetical protein